MRNPFDGAPLHRIFSCVNAWNPWTCHWKRQNSIVCYLCAARTSPTTSVSIGLLLPSDVRAFAELGRHRCIQSRLLPSLVLSMYIFICIYTFFCKIKGARLVDISCTYPRFESNFLECSNALMAPSLAVNFRTALATPPACLVVVNVNGKGKQFAWRSSEWGSVV
jgi:hypothetical protein